MGFQYRGPAWRKQVMKDIHLKATHCLCPFLTHSLFPVHCELSSFSLSDALMVYHTRGPKQRNKLTMDLNLYNFNSASLLPLNYLLRYFVPIRKGDTHSNTHCGSLFLLICYHLQDRSLTKAHWVSTSFLLFNAKSIKDQKIAML